MAQTRFTGPVASDNGFIGAIVATTPLNVTGGLTVTSAYAGSPITLNAAAGQAIVLPNATGSGSTYRFFVGTTITSNSTTIKVARAADIMTGMALFAQDAGDTVVAFETAVDSDTITFNGTTTGGIKGTQVELVDIAANLWAVNVCGAATGTEATPFSATV